MGRGVGERDEPSGILSGPLDTAWGRGLGPASALGQQRPSPWPTGCSVSALGSMLGNPLALPVLTIPLSWQDQYQLCYRAALEYLGSFDHYAT